MRCFKQITKYFYYASSGISTFSCINFYSNLFTDVYSINTISNIQIKLSNSCNHHHHHHVVPLTRISLTLSHHFSQSFIASGWSSGLHLVSSHNCCMYVRAGRPAFAWPYARIHRSTSLMSSSLLLQQCPACLVRLTLIVFVMAGSWPYS